MKTQLRHLVADALYPTKAYNLPSVCERYGLEPGDSDEAFSSKTRYVMRRLEKLSDEQVFNLAKSVVQDMPDDKLLAAIEQIEKGGYLVSDITRHHLAEALDDFSLAGKRDLLEMLRKYCLRLIIPDRTVISSRRWRTILTSMPCAITTGGIPLF